MANQFGPNDPHPFSTIKTELIWEGKYDNYGNKRELNITGESFPLQKIETIDEPLSRALVQGSLFESGKAHRDDWRNYLIWGDNKLVMASLLKDFKGKIDLVYIDPPFDVGADFTFEVPIGEEDESIRKDQSTLEMVAYRDTWGKGTDSYLQMMYERLTLISDLLSETGSIFVHCDYRVNAYLHIMLHELFDSNYRNEIIWCYTGPGSPGMMQFNRKHENIYWYTKKDKGYKFMDRLIRVPHDNKTQANFKSGLRGSGFMGDNYDLPEGKIPEDWWEMAVAPRYPVDGIFRVGYATEKPYPLIERIIKACTEEGDIVADLFCGSGTLGAMAELLGRRWIMCDLGRFAIHTSRKRLIEVQRKLHAEQKPYRSFDVYNLGRYERQWWQKESLKGADEEHRRVVLAFYRAEPLPNPTSPLLHGRKAGSFVHVDKIDSIFTRQEVRLVALATKEAGGWEVNCLAWEFEMDLRLTCDALESELGVKIKLIPIPREIMEKNRKDPPPFLEVATLEAEPVYHKNGDHRFVDIKLTRFLPSLAEVPSKELEALKERAIRSGFDFIDFWAVDFNWHPDQPFNHHWQAYRSRKNRALPSITDQHFTYPNSGRHLACIKVVDVFGVDTSITVEIEV